MIRQRIFLIIILVMILAPSLCLADRGMIPHDPNVQLFEPNQRALIAWSGQEEILLLTTDLRASAPTRVLEVLPCPSEPTVKKGSLKTFEHATYVINTHIRRPDKKRNGGKSVDSHSRDQSAGEVTFHAQIGAHDVSVTHVLSGDGFVSWIENALKNQGVKNPTVPAWVKSAISGYIAEGFDWFVFDSVELGPEIKTAQPLAYRFKTDRLFYPLKITKVNGPTTVDLIILTPKLLSTFPQLPSDRVELPHPPFEITGRELRFIDKDISALLGDKDGMTLRIWKIRDHGKGFDKDLIAH